MAANLLLVNGHADLTGVDWKSIIVQAVYTISVNYKADTKPDIMQIREA
jgi:hypothetical protein